MINNRLPVHCWYQWTARTWLCLQFCALISDVKKQSYFFCWLFWTPTALFAKKKGNFYNKLVWQSGYLLGYLLGYSEYCLSSIFKKMIFHEIYTVLCCEGWNITFNLLPWFLFFFLGVDCKDIFIICLLVIMVTFIILLRKFNNSEFLLRLPGNLNEWKDYFNL